MNCSVALKGTKPLNSIRLNYTRIELFFSALTKCVKIFTAKERCQPLALGLEEDGIFIEDLTSFFELLAVSYELCLNLITTFGSQGPFTKEDLPLEIRTKLKDNDRYLLHGPKHKNMWMEIVLYKAKLTTSYEITVVFKDITSQNYCWFTPEDLNKIIQLLIHYYVTEIR